MTIIQHAAGAAAIALAALSPIPASAQTRVPVSISVKTADLDLSRAEGRATLNRRISGAARAACGRGNLRGYDARDAHRCYREMMADGTRQIAALSTKSAVQVASLDRR